MEHDFFEIKQDCAKQKQNADQFSIGITEGQLKGIDDQKIKLSDTHSLGSGNKDQLFGGEGSLSLRHYLHANSKITGNLCETHQLFFRSAIQYFTEFGVMPPLDFHEQILWAMAESRDAGPEVQEYVLNNLERRAFSKNLKNNCLPRPLNDGLGQIPFESSLVGKKVVGAIVGNREKAPGMVDTNEPCDADLVKEGNGRDEFFKVGNRKENSNEHIVNSEGQSSGLNLLPPEPAHSEPKPPWSPKIHSTGCEQQKHAVAADENAVLRQHLAIHAMPRLTAEESHAAYRRCAARFCIERDQMPHASFQEQVLWAMAENPFADPELHNYVFAMFDVEHAHAAVVYSSSSHESHTTEVRPENRHCADASCEPRASSQEPETANPFEELGGDVITPRTNAERAELAPPNEEEVDETLSGKLEGYEPISVLPTVTMLEGEGFNSPRGQAQGRKITASHDGEALHQYLLRNATEGQNTHSRHALFLRCACMYYLETNELPPADIQQQILWAMASCSDVCRDDFEFIFRELGNQEKSKSHLGGNVEQDNRTDHVRGEVIDCNEPAFDSKTLVDFSEVGCQNFTDSLVSKVGHAQELVAGCTCNFVASAKAFQLPTETEDGSVESAGAPPSRLVSYSCSDTSSHCSQNYTSETVPLHDEDAGFCMITPVKGGNKIQVQNSIEVDYDNCTISKLDSESGSDFVVSDCNSQTVLSTCNMKDYPMADTTNLDFPASEETSSLSCHIMPVLSTQSDSEPYHEKQQLDADFEQQNQSTALSGVSDTILESHFCPCIEDYTVSSGVQEGTGVQQVYKDDLSGQCSLPEPYHEKQQLDADFEQQNQSTALSGVSDTILESHFCPCIEDYTVSSGVQEGTGVQQVYKDDLSGQCSLPLLGFGDQESDSPVTAGASSVLFDCFRRLFVKNQNIHIAKCKRTFFSMLQSNAVLMRAAKVLTAYLRSLLVRSQFAGRFRVANSVQSSESSEDIEITNVLENNAKVLESEAHSELLLEGFPSILALSAWFKYDGCVVRFHDKHGNKFPVGRLSVVNLDTEPRFFPNETSNVDPSEPVIPFDSAPVPGMLQEDRPCMFKQVVPDNDNEGKERVMASTGVIVKRNGVIVGVRSGGQNFSLTDYIHRFGLDCDSNLLTPNPPSHCPCYLWEGSCARCSSFGNQLLSVSCNFPERLIRVQIHSQVAGELEHIPLLYYAPSLTVSSMGLCQALGVDTADHTSRLSVVSVLGALPSLWYPELVGKRELVFRNIKTGSTYVEHPCLVERCLKDLKKEINEASKRRGASASMSNNLPICQFRFDTLQGMVRAATRPSTASVLLSNAHKPLQGVSKVIAKPRPATAFEAKTPSCKIYKSSILEVMPYKDEQHAGSTSCRNMLTAQAQHHIWRAAARLQGVFRGHLCRIMVLVSKRDLPTTELPLQLSILAHSMVRLPSTFQLFKRLVSSEHNKIRRRGTTPKAERS
jgi:hypothetical protein